MPAINDLIEQLVTKKNDCKPTCDGVCEECNIYAEVLKELVAAAVAHKKKHHVNVINDSFVRLEKETTLEGALAKMPKPIPGTNRIAVSNGLPLHLAFLDDSDPPEIISATEFDITCPVCKKLNVKNSSILRHKPAHESDPPDTFMQFIYTCGCGGEYGYNLLKNKAGYFSKTYLMN